MIRTLTEHTGVQGAPYFSHHYFFGSDQASADAAVAAVDAFWTDLAPVIQSTLQMQVHQEVEEVDVATGAIVGVFSTAGGTANGGDTDSQLSGATQGLIRWRTGVFEAGREIRGRTFIPVPTELVNVNGNPDPGYITLANASAQNLIDAGVNAGGLVIYSQTHFRLAQVVTGNTWNRWAVLRSRRD